MFNMSKEKFLKTYANLPVTERTQIIAILDEVPYSWDVAYSEIFNDTKLGKKILKKIESLNII